MSPNNSSDLLIQYLYLTIVGLVPLTQLYFMVLAYKRRTLPGARSFFMIALTICITSVTYLGQILSPTESFALAMTRLKFIGIVFMPLSFLRFALDFTGRGSWITTGKFVALSIIPVISIMIAAVSFNDALFIKEWSLTSYGFLKTDHYELTGWGRVSAFYTIALFIASITVLIAYAIRKENLYRGQVAWFALWIMLSAYLSNASVTFFNTPLKLAPVGQFIFIVAFGGVLLHYRILDLIPIAYDQIFRGIQQGIIVLNRNGVVLQVNFVAQSALRKTATDLVGKPISAVPKLGFDPALNASGKAKEIALYDGEYYEVSQSALTDRYGQWAGSLIMMRDVTHEKLTQTELQNSELRYSELLQNAPIAISVVDIETFDLVYVNPACNKLLPLPEIPFEELSKRWTSFIPMKDMEQFKASLATLSPQSGPVIGEYTLNFFDSGPFYLKTQTVLARYNDRPALLVTINNVTEAKLALEAEADLRKFTEALLDISAKINTSLHLEEVLALVLSHLSQVVSYDRANVMLVEDDEGYVVGHRGYHGKESAFIEKFRAAVKALPVMSRMIQVKEPVIINDISTQAGWINFEEVASAKSYIAAPIIRGENVIGILQIDSFTLDRYTDRDATRLKAFANQIAAAITNAQVYEHAREDATNIERQRLARDLHDSVTQTIYAASLTAEGLPRLMDHDPDYVREGLAQLAKLTNGALSEMRTLLVELRPSALDETELNFLLSHLITSLMSRSNASVSFSVRGAVYPIPTEAKISLYRIAQEALNNCAKHSRATKIDVLLNYGHNTVMIRIEDNGIGFDARGVSGEHLGLSIMRERASIPDLRFELKSEVGKGTTVETEWKVVDKVVDKMTTTTAAMP